MTQRKARRRHEPTEAEATPSYDVTVELFQRNNRPIGTVTCRIEEDDRGRAATKARAKARGTFRTFQVRVAKCVKVKEEV